MLPAWSSSPFYLSMLPMMHCSSEAKAAAAWGRVCSEGRRFGKQAGLLAFPLLGWMFLFCFVSSGEQCGSSPPSPVPRPPPPAAPEAKSPMATLEATSLLPRVALGGGSRCWSWALRTISFSSGLQRADFFVREGNPAEPGI